MIPKDKHITLSMVDIENVPFDPALYLTCSWNADWYCNIMQMPVAEMLGSSIVSLAEELIRMTQSTDWLSQRRRTVGQGDIMYIGNSAWLYIFTEHTGIFSGAGMEVYRLLAWPEVSMVRLNHEDHHPVPAREEA